VSIQLLPYKKCGCNGILEKYNNLNVKIPPPPRTNGWACSKSSDCKSNYCMSDICQDCDQVTNNCDQGASSPCYPARSPSTPSNCSCVPSSSPKISSPTSHPPPTKKCVEGFDGNKPVNSKCSYSNECDTYNCLDDTCQPCQNANDCVNTNTDNCGPKNSNKCKCLPKPDKNYKYCSIPSASNNT